MIVSQKKLNLIIYIKKINTTPFDRNGIAQNSYLLVFIIVNDW